MGLTRGAAQAGQKCGRAGEAARTHGRGVSEGGGLPGPYHTRPCFPFSVYVNGWSSG
jgi:hypothetical protein